MVKIINFPLQNFFHKVFEEAKRKQDDIKRKKTEFLYREAYRYFLDLYLMKIVKEKVVDFPAFMYEAGLVICKEAQTNAEQVMLDVIKQNRIDSCYSKRIKEIKKFAAI